MSWEFNRTAWVREIGMGWLPGLGRPALPLLRSALGDEDHKVREAARTGLLRLDPDQVVPLLIESLHDEELHIVRRVQGGIVRFTKP